MSRCNRRPKSLYSVDCAKVSDNSIVGIKHYLRLPKELYSYRDLVLLMLDPFRFNGGTSRPSLVHPRD